MRKLTIPFLVLTIISGLYGFAGYNLWGTEVSRVIFLIAADLFVVSLFAKILFRNHTDDPRGEEA